MAPAKEGDVVRVHYTGKLDDGEVFDSSVGGPPLQFELGCKQVIAGFEQAVIGMSPGEQSRVVIPVEQAYGPHDDEKVLVAQRGQFPDHVKPRVGQHLQITGEQGEPTVFTVIEVADSTVTLDANHPLAGKALTFEIELVDIG